MPDEPGRINLDEFRDRKGPPKRKTKAGADHDEHPGAAAREAAKLVADDPKLADKSIEQLSELAIRRMANVVLRGGDDFLPTTLKEASDAAKTWASVASMETARKAGKGTGQSEDDPVVRETLALLTELKQKGLRQ